MMTIAIKGMIKRDTRDRDTKVMKGIKETIEVEIAVLLEEEIEVLIGEEIEEL